MWKPGYHSLALPALHGMRTEQNGSEPAPDAYLRTFQPRERPSRMWEWGVPAAEQQIKAQVLSLQLLGLLLRHRFCSRPWFLARHNALRICCYCSSCIGCSRGLESIPGLGTSLCCKCSQKKKKNVGARKKLVVSLLCNNVTSWLQGRKNYNDISTYFLLMMGLDCPWAVMFVCPRRMCGWTWCNGSTFEVTGVSKQVSTLN